MKLSSLNLSAPNEDIKMKMHLVKMHLDKDALGEDDDALEAILSLTLSTYHLSLTLSTYHVWPDASFHSKVYTSLYINVHISGNKCQSGYLNWMKRLLEYAAAFSGNTDIDLKGASEMASDHKHWKEMINHKWEFISAGHSNDWGDLIEYK